jgi:hypothetical protein
LHLIEHTVYINQYAMKRYSEALIIVGIALITLLPYAVRFAFDPISSLHDDSYYYFKTAQNIAAGLGSTFDGINITNGYHPLWMMICAATAFFVSDPHVYVSVILCVNLLIICLFNIQTLRMFGPRLGVVFSCFLLVLINWNLYTNLQLFSGLETSLYLLLVITCIDLITDINFDDWKRTLLLGVLFGLAFLARTDFALFLPVAGMFLVKKGVLKDKRKFINCACFLTAPFLIIAVPYLMWNYSVTGHIEQVSGLVQGLYSSDIGTFGRIKIALRDLPKSALLRPYIFNLLLLPWLGLLFLRVFNKRAFPEFLKDERLRLLAGFSILAVGFYYWSFAERTRAWHIMIPWFTAQIVFVSTLKFIADGLSDRKVFRWIINSLIIAACSVCVGQLLVWNYNSSKQNPYFQSTTNYYDELAKWLRHNVPEQSKVGVFNAGYIGFFSGRTVVNLDGLINGRELYEYLKSGRTGWHYAVDKKLDYVADHFFGPPYESIPPELKDRFRLIHRVGKTDLPENRIVDAYVYKIER